MKHKSIKKRKPQQRLPAEERARRNESIEEEFKAGRSMKELARQHDLSINSISQILRNAGVVARDKASRNKSVWEGYLAGMSREELAEKHSITEGLVYRILHDHGVVVHEDKGPRDIAIAEGYRAGTPINDLATQYDLSRSRVEQILHQENVPFRQQHVDLAGLTFNRLTVIRQAGTHKGERQWLCRCACGNKHVALTAKLTGSRVKSCGCLAFDVKHGHTRRGGKTAEYAILANAKVRARKADVPFFLTLDDIHIPETCPVLGIPLQPGKGKLTDNSPSLDRLIPELGYVLGNVKIISYRANRLKGNATAEEIEKVARWIRSNTGGHDVLNKPGTFTPPDYVKEYDLRPTKRPTRKDGP